MNDPTPSALEPGRMLAHYRLVEKIGEGGMGVVWKALDTNLEREVAIKSLPAEYAQDTERLARFEREAKVLAGLNHPGIAVIHGLHQVNGLNFLAMELAPGEDLGARLARGALPLDDAVDVALQMAEALEAAHESGIVHRDLKPANIQLGPDGKIKVLDFGLAKALEGEASGQSGSMSLTQSPTVAYGTVAGVILGTAGYMSPEQARGRSVDRRADIWAFGCVLFECLTGRQAFEGETISDTLASILKSEPDWSSLPGATPQRVRQLLERCLVKNPTDRLRDIGEARIALAAARGGDEEIAVAAAKPTSPWRRRLPWMIALLMTGVAIMGIIETERAKEPASVVRLSVVVPDSVRLSSGEEQNIAISPTGSHVAIAGRVGGRADRLYIRAMDQTQTRVLEGTDGVRNPVFSPDGQWIAFEADGKLKKIPVQGGPAVELCELSQPRGIAWAPDGRIVFTPVSSAGLYTVPETGGIPVAITTVDSSNGERTHRWPYVLPDGKRVLFTVGTIEQPGEYDGARIDIVGLDGKNQETVFEGASMALYAPTGHLLLCRAGVVLAVPFDPRSNTITGTPVPVVHGVAGKPSSGVVYVGLDRNGSLAYVEQDPQVEQARLVRIDRAGTVTTLAAPARNYRDVRLSPDGTRAVFSIGPGGGGQSDVWMYDIERESLNRLTFDERSNDPIWSRDGKRIVFHSAKEGRDWFVSKRADGSGTEQVIYKSDVNTTPTWLDDWSPDGKYLTFVEYVSGSLADIWIVPADGGEPRPFVQSESSEYRMKFSPDGNWVAYSRIDRGRVNVYVEAFPGPGGRWQITSDAGGSPMWSRDGTELYFISKGQLWSCPVQTSPTFVPGRPQPLFDWPSVPFRTALSIEYPYDTTPDGKGFIALVTADQDRDAVRLNVALNWLGELERLVPVK